MVLHKHILFGHFLRATKLNLKDGKIRHNNHTKALEQTEVTMLCYVSMGCYGTWTRYHPDYNKEPDQSNIS